MRPRNLGRTVLRFIPVLRLLYTFTHAGVCTTWYVVLLPVVFSVVGVRGSWKGLAWRLAGGCARARVYASTPK